MFYRVGVLRYLKGRRMYFVLNTKYAYEAYEDARSRKMLTLALMVIVIKGIKGLKAMPSISLYYI